MVFPSSDDHACQVCHHSDAAAVLRSKWKMSESRCLMTIMTIMPVCLVYRKLTVLKEKGHTWGERTKASVSRRCGGFFLNRGGPECAKQRRVDVTCTRTCWASTTSTSEACADQQGIPITQTQHKVHIAITIAAQKKQTASATKLHSPIYVYNMCFYFSHLLTCCGWHLPLSL